MSRLEAADLVLIPNVGAEEGENWASLHELPAVEATVNLWRGLFPESHKLLGVESNPTHDPWPSALGPRPPHAAMPWLEASGAQCWLADEPAHTLALAAGLHWMGPAPDRVLEAHDKAFALRVSRELDLDPPILRGLSSIFEPDELAAPEDWLTDLETRLSTWPAWTGHRFTLKPRLGSSGRGRVGGIAGNLDRRQLLASRNDLSLRGGAILEPWLDREADFSVQIHIPPPDPAHSLITILGALELWVNPGGLYRGHLGEVDSRGRVFTGGPFEETAREAAAALAERARAVGYFGPCGVDGLAFRQPQANGQPAISRIRPVVELNARFTLGTVVIGLVRRSLSQLENTLGLRPGQRRALLFALDTPPHWPDWESLAAAVDGPTLLLPLAPARSATRPALLFGSSLADLRSARDRFAAGSPAPSREGEPLG